MSVIPALTFPTKPVWPSTLGKPRIRLLQRELNKFFKTHMTGFAPLIEDGKMGQLTRRRIRQAKYYLGQIKPGRFSLKVNRQFLQRLRKPNDPKLVIGKTPAQTIKRGRNRRKHQANLHKASQMHYSGKPHWVTYDGKMIAAYLQPINDWARKTGAVINGRHVKWRGVVVSGGRTEAYSIHLCMVMCGRPFCPGRCAGASTNHVGNDPNKVPSGAEDVSDYVVFGQLMHYCPFHELNTVPIHNDLPIDRVHYSPSGH